MRKIFATVLMLLPLAACHSQVTPTPGYNIAWTWTAPTASSSWAGCTTAAPCSYIVSVATLAAGATVCPPTTGTAYTPLNASSPATGTSYIQTNATGLTVCAIAQTEQTQSGQTSPSVSLPSNSALVTVPAVPLAPSTPAPAAQIAMNEKLPAATVQLAMNVGQIKLTGKLVKVH